MSGRSGPDPAQGSAGVSTAQSRFVGSDRQGRGRLVDALRNGPLRTTAAAAAAGWPEDPDRARRMVDALVAEGLVVEDGQGTLRLP
jgi:A/G-specific adenine glycosylase